ncbi:MAG: methyltransferase, TIGR04325 family [Opitutae bacterium]|jgi:putative methyltransferase (TIGR04325 family)|nr:methyltransferase, TIGR04325 family [Opitutae bacterium]
MSISYLGPFNSWEEARKLSSGYCSEKILESVLETTKAVVKGEYLFERDSVGFKKPSYEWPMCTAIFSAMNKNNGKLSLLDFGGSLASRYFQHINLFGHDALEWNIVEQEHFVKAGKELFKNRNLNFFNTIEDCFKEKKIDFVLLSSVLQYLKDPFRTIRELLNLQPKGVFIDRTYVSKICDSLIYVQQNNEDICESSYPFFLLSEETLISSLNGFKMAFDFKSNYTPESLKDINGNLKGYYFTF